MGRTALIFVFLVVAFAITFAPAALLRQLLAAQGDLGLTALSGTLWNGEGTLIIQGRSAGRLQWRLTPVTFLQGALGYHMTLSGPDHALDANLVVGVRALELTLDGHARGTWLNQWLYEYDIELSGDFTFSSVSLALPYTLQTGNAAALAPGTAAGRLDWSGGPVRYILALEEFRGELPALEARLGEGLRAIVTPTGSTTPVLTVELLGNGFIKIGLTRLLTRMLNTPWPGGEADHEVVLVVEEQLL